MTSRSVLVLIVATCLAGCALKAPPDVAELRKEALPNAQVPAAWTAKGAAAGAVADNWVAGFNDPALDALVQEAIAHNPDLRVAAARVEQAEGYVRVAGATLLPAVQALGAGGKGSGSGGLNFGGIFANWELDLWGRVRAGREAATLQYQSADLDLAYARQSIAAAVAKGWFLATEARLQRALAAEIVRSTQRSESLAGDRQRVGVGDEYDLALVRANLETYRDALRQLDLAYEQSLRALEVLLGRYPAAAVEAAAALPAMPGPVPPGMPSELLERRPDVVAAERRIAAAFYRVEEAKAAMLPRIALTANVNYLSSDILQLTSDSNIVWGLGANLIAPLYLGGQLRAQVDIRTAEQKQAIAEYGRIGARAFAEVENALSGEISAREREAILARAVANSQRALELSETRYRVGSGDLRAVTQQQVVLYGTRATLLRVQADQRVQRVNLYLALGGGFGTSAAPLASNAQP